MFEMMAWINIMVIDIILVLALVILVRKENSVIGHAKGRKTVAAA